MLALFSSRTVVFQVQDWSVTWYGLLFLSGFVLAYWWLPRLQHKRGLKLSRQQWFEIVVWSAVGAIICGRLGYALWYEPAFYFTHPWQLVLLRGGGMASHGGFIGAGLALWLLSRRYQVPALKLFDVVVVAAAVGLALGRLGNVINQELFPTTAAQVIGVSSNLIVAGVSYYHLSFVRRARPGQTTALGLILYGWLRLGVELVRDQPWSYTLGLTRGQLLTVPLLLFGWWLWLYLRRRVKPLDL